MLAQIMHLQSFGRHTQRQSRKHKHKENTSQAACAEHLEHIQSKGSQRFLMEACDIKDIWKLF